MDFFSNVFDAARGGIKERDDQIASLQVERDGYRKSLRACEDDLAAAQALVKEAGEKQEAYNTAIADYDRVVAHCDDLKCQLEAVKKQAEDFASEFNFPVPEPEAAASDGEEAGSGETPA